MPQKGINSFKNFIKFQNSNINKGKKNSNKGNNKITELRTILQKSYKNFSFYKISKFEYLNNNIEK